MPEKKSYYNQAKNEYTQKYQREKLEQINFRVKKGTKQKYTEAASGFGLSIANFFTAAADEYMENHGKN